MAKRKIIPVILCGGSGTRLWPISRENFPKQFLNLVGENSLLQETALPRGKNCERRAGRSGRCHAGRHEGKRRPADSRYQPHLHTARSGGTFRPQHRCRRRPLPLLTFWMFSDQTR
jgi:hypothetical protein